MGMRFSGHATDQMTDRAISAKEVAEALANVQTSYPSSRPGRDDRTVILGRTTTGRRLKIVVVTATPDYIVTVADRDMED